MRQIKPENLWNFGGRLACLILLAIGALPALAQIDLSGEWAPRFHEDEPERIPGPAIGDYLGLPINAAARMRADTWDASLLTLPEHQCKPHPADYGPRGPANLRFWKEVDRATQQIIAWHTHISWQAPERTIYMDDRPRPGPLAAHTWQGFSLGKWDGNVLTVVTTHLKTGWIRRNGVPRSDQATLVEHWIRHKDGLTLVSIVHDPVYLTEPFVRTTDWELDLSQQIEPYPCEPVIEVVRERGEVPHHLPGTNPFLNEFPENSGAGEAARGGAATMYPGGVDTNPYPFVKSPVPAPFSNGETEITQPVQGKLTLIATKAGNIAVQTGPQGTLLVDTGDGSATKDVIAAIRSITDAPIRTIINTSAAPEHTGGNRELSELGGTITGGNFARASANWAATVVAHENVVNQMSEEEVDDAAWPGDTYFTNGKDLFFNGEAVQVIHIPEAHTDGDSIVFFRRSDVIATGDVFNSDRYPLVDVARGGTINGELEALNTLLDLAIPEDKQEGGTMLIGGSGRVSDEADLVEYRDMATIIRDRVRALKDKGMTLEQVQAERLTFDYDPIYDISGKQGAEFVASIYQTLP